MSIPIISNTIKQRSFFKALSQTLDNQLVAGVLCVVMFLFINPFLAVFFVALISFISNVPKCVYSIFASLSFALIFYARDYGVSWAGSTDDIPNYIIYFHSNDNLSIGDIFTRFFLIPSGTEPIWHILCWVLINIFHASDSDFIFTYYLILFLFLFACFLILSKEHYTLFAVIFFFLTPASMDALFHIWRQELALLVYLIGISLQLVRNKRSGLFLIYITPLIHLSFLYFVILFSVYLYFKNKGTTNTKRKYLFFLAIVSILVSLFYITGVTLLDASGLEAVTGYSSDSGENKARIFIVVIINTCLLLLTYVYLKNDDLNKFFLVLFFPILAIIFSFPGSNAIYGRLSIAVLPMLGIYIFRCFLLNFSNKLLPFLTVIIFLTGSLRIYLAYPVFCTQFLAYCHLFDPTLGIVKSISGIK
jgi:hypothetical protein